MPLPVFRLSALPLRTVKSSRPRFSKSPRPKSVMSQPSLARRTSPARCLLRRQSSSDQLANSGSLNPKEAMNFSPSRMISFNSDRFMRVLSKPCSRSPGAFRRHHIMEVRALEQVKTCAHEAPSDTLSPARLALEIESQELAKAPIADRRTGRALMDIDV